MLINTDCTSPILKRWFLFSCFSGQAFAECLKMEWRDIIEEGGVTRIVGTRIKTNIDYVVPINNEAKFYL
jgi:integrase